MSNKKTMKFSEAYSQLKAIAEEIQAQPEVVIDVIEEKLKQATKLHAVCKDRLNKVQQMLEKFKADTLSTVDNNHRLSPKPKATLKPSSECDDDIPF